MDMKDMFNSNKIMDRFFRKVEGATWDLMSGKLGIKTSEGIVTMEGEGDDASVTLNMFDNFGIAVPAFAQNTPHAGVQVGDLIFGAKGPLGWVVKINEKSFELLKADGTRTKWSPPKVAMFGFEGGVMVLRSLINMLPGGSSGLAGIQGAMLPMMAMMGDDADISDLMPLMLMGQMGMGIPGTAPDGTATAANPMTQMLPMMLMMKMLGGNKGNGGGNFFDKGRR